MNFSLFRELLLKANRYLSEYTTIKTLNLTFYAIIIGYNNALLIRCFVNYRERSSRVMIKIVDFLFLKSRQQIASTLSA